MDFEQALYRDGKVRKEWEKFIRGESVDRTVVRDLVLRAWERAQAHGMDPHDNNIQLVANEELERLLVKNKLLLDCAIPILKDLFCEPLASKTNIMISDANGVILYKLAALMGPPFVSPNFVGCTLSQNVLTCIIERVPVVLLAAEHYCEPQQQICCHAAPIFNARHELAGVLSFSTSKGDAHYLRSSLIETAANSIGEKLRLCELIEEKEVLIELLDKGVIVLDAKGVIRSANKKALSMLGILQRPSGIQINDLIEPNNLIVCLLEDNILVREQETSFHVKSSQTVCSCVVSTARVPSSSFFILTMSQTKRPKNSISLVKEAKSLVTFEQIIGISSGLMQCIALARQAAKSNVTTLILGESGTGKELIAQSIHTASARAGHPFIVVNCGAIPRDLVQSILFGYEAGAYTGAAKSGQPGKFEQANGGSLFLDEIGEMPFEAQTSLLRLLQAREVIRVGGTRTRFVDVRILAATNKNLAEAVRNGSFREDLYYRLNVFPISLPPLRERRRDIDIFVKHFIHRMHQSLPCSPESMSGEALEALYSYSWPGNVRELENTIERLMNLVTRQEITLEDLPECIRYGKEKGPHPYVGKESSTEYAILAEALRKTGGNIRKAAFSLGISRSSFYYRLKGHHLDPAQFRKGSKIGDKTWEQQSTVILETVTGQNRVGMPAPDSTSLQGFSERQLQLLHDFLRKMESEGKNVSF